MLNPLYTAEEMHRQLADSGRASSSPCRSGLPRCGRPSPGRGSRRSSSSARPGATPFRRSSQHDEPLPPVAIDPAEDVVMLPYSSGTTGRPKGVMLTHRNLVAAVLTRRPLLPSPEDDTVVGVSPFFHIAGICPTELRRSMPAPRSSSCPASICTRSCACCRTIGQRARRSRRRSSSSSAGTDRGRVRPLAARIILWGAAPLGEAVARACRERLGCRVKQVYGLTEGSRRDPRGAHRPPRTGRGRPVHPCPAPSTRSSTSRPAPPSLRASAARSACAARW